MNETSIILSSGSLITLIGFYFKLKQQTVEDAAKSALMEKRLTDLERDLEKSNKDIDDIKSTLHKIDTRTQVILSKLENKP
jgi:hypothetical protein